MIAGDLLLRPLPDIPRIAAGDDLVEIILDAAARTNEPLRDGDVLVVTQKIVSKAEGRLVDLATVVASARARSLAGESGKDERLVELILRESSEILRCRPGLIIVVHRLGFILANAGIDQSNVGHAGSVLLLPVDPDDSAARIREGMRRKVGTDIAVLIIDSMGRAWRRGTIGTAIGVSGISALLDLHGRKDLFERKLETTELGFADELASAASLVMGQADENRPVVLVRGLSAVRQSGSARDLLRPKEQDLFR